MSFASSDLLLQDECKGLSQFLARDPQARRHVRERCEEIKMGYFKDLGVRIGEAKDKVRDALRREGLTAQRMELVGSSYITDKTDSDLDILCYVPISTYQPSVGCMQFTGWAYGGSVGEGGEDTWGSWKHYFPGIGEVNILVTTDETYFNAWLTSAEVCRYLHLRGIVVPRAERVSIHNIIMDDSTADYEVNPVKGL